MNRAPREGERLRVIDTLQVDPRHYAAMASVTDFAARNRRAGVVGIECGPVTPVSNVAWWLMPDGGTERDITPYFLDELEPETP